jgi:hypothetical protein
MRRNGSHSTAFIACSDGLLRATVDPDDLTAPEFPTFVQTTTRNPVQALNVWFVLMNAEVKFRRFKQNYGFINLHPSIRAMAEQTIEIADLIYSKPSRSESYRTARVPGGIGRSVSSRRHLPGTWQAIRSQSSHSNSDPEDEGTRPAVRTRRERDRSILNPLS